MNKEMEHQLEYCMKELNLQGIIPIYKDVIKKAVKDKLSYEEYLSVLFGEEINRKRSSSVNRRILKAKFPSVKTLESFDFSFQPTVNEKEILSLSSLDFIDKKSNVILLGPPGVGKTHLAISLGQKACMARYRVLFTSAKLLLEELSISELEGSLMDKLTYYSRLNLLIIDELGYTPINKRQANLLYEIISTRYEKGAVILTSNYSLDEWEKIFNDIVVANAIIDRLVHHSNIIYINGGSYRTKDKFKKLE